MNILKYTYPKVSGANLAFPIFDAPEPLLKEAKNRGFYYGNTKSNDLFSRWFFSGLKAGEVKVREELDKKEVDNALLFAMSLMGSFKPKHEEKEAVCALIFSETLLWNGENLNKYT